MRDIDTGKVYIGPEDPKDDRSKTTLNGDKMLSPMFLGAKKNSEILMNYLTYSEALIHNDMTNEMEITIKYI